MAQYYAAHQTEFRKPGQMQAALIVTNTAVDATTALDLLQRGVDPSIIANQPSFHLVGPGGYTIDLKAPAQRPLVNAIFAMSRNEVRSFPLGSKFLTVKVFQTQEAQIAPLSEVKDQVVRAARLQKAISPKAELAKLYRENPPQFDIPKYSSFFDDAESPGERLKTTPTAP